MSKSDPGTIQIRITRASDDVVGYLDFRCADPDAAARRLSQAHVSLKGDGDALADLLIASEEPEPAHLELEDALMAAASDAGLGVVNAVPDLGDLMDAAPPTESTPVEPIGMIPDEATQIDEPTEEEYAEELQRRIRAQSTRTLFIDNLRSAQVTGDKREMVIEVIRSDGQHILEVSYVARGSNFCIGDESTELARVSLDGDLIGCIPRLRAAVLWRAGAGSSQVKLHGGPKGCVQKLSPGEVLEVRDTDSERWIVRQVPVASALEPERAVAVPAATMEDGPFWDESSPTELTH